MSELDSLNMIKPFVICGFSCLLVLFFLFQVALFIWDSVILLSYTECINCIDPIYTWLSCVTALQILTLNSDLGIVMSLFRIICTIIAYCYGIEYYGNRDLCSGEGSDAIYTLIVVHLTVYTIEYIIIILFIIFCVVLVCGFNAETRETNEIINKLQPLKSINLTSLISSNENKKQYEGF